MIPWERLRREASEKRRAAAAAAAAEATPAPPAPAPLPALQQMLASPTLVQLAAAAAAEPTRLRDLLLGLQASEPALLALVSAEQEAFRQLLAYGGKPPSAAPAAPAAPAAAGGGTAAASELPATPDLHDLRALLGWFKHDFFTWVDKVREGIT